MRDADECDDQIYVGRDHDRRLRFHGELLGSAETSPDSGDTNFSGSVGCWTVMRLYQTTSGTFICEMVDHTLHGWENECKDVAYTAAVCDTGEQVMAFFGHNRLAKEVYDQAQIDDTELIL